MKALTIHRSYFEVFRGHEGLEFSNRVLRSHLPFAKHECLFRNARYVFFLSSLLASLLAYNYDYVCTYNYPSSSWCKDIHVIQWGWCFRGLKLNASAMTFLNSFFRRLFNWQSMIILLLYHH